MKVLIISAIWNFSGIYEISQVKKFEYTFKVKV